MTTTKNTITSEKNNATVTYSIVLLKGNEVKREPVFIPAIVKSGKEMDYVHSLQREYAYLVLNQTAARVKTLEDRLEAIANSEEYRNASEGKREGMKSEIVLRIKDLSHAKEEFVATIGWKGSTTHVDRFARAVAFVVYCPYWGEKVGRGAEAHYINDFSCGTFTSREMAAMLMKLADNYTAGTDVDGTKFNAVWKYAAGITAHWLKPSTMNTEIYTPHKKTDKPAKEDREGLIYMARGEYKADKGYLKKKHPSYTRLIYQLFATVLSKCYGFDGKTVDIEHAVAEIEK